MSTTKRALNNVFWLVFSEVSSRFLLFLGTIYLTRVIGKAGFGLYSLSLAVGACLWVIADMGVVGYGTREIARNKERATELCSILNSLRFFLAIILFLIFSVVIYFMDMPFEKKIILSAGAFYIVAFSLSSDWVLRGIEKMQYITLGRAITSVSFLGGIYLIVHAPSDTYWASIIYSLSFFIGSLAFIVLLRNKFHIQFSFKISFISWWHHIKESVYFSINGAFIALSSFAPIFIMGVWSTNEELGVFSAPHRLAMMVINMSGLMAWGLYPTLSSFYVTDKDKFKKIHSIFQEFIIVMTLPVCILATVFSKDIIVLLFGSAYTDSGRIFNILIWLIFITLVRRSLAIAFLSADLQRLNMFATGTGACVIILSGLYLIPRYNGYGASWVLFVGEFISLIIMSEIFRKKIYSFEFIKSFVAKVILTGTVMGLIVISLPFSAILNSTIGILSYGILSLSIGVVSRKTIQQFYHSLVR
jgi:O-antigen/teichoic acid export membrane protein